MEVQASDSSVQRTGARLKYTDRTSMLAFLLMSLSSIFRKTDR
jgi:hypothetical protein